MFKIKLFLFAILLPAMALLFRGRAFAEDEVIHYKIENEDELGKIIQKFEGTPLWGPHGLVKKVIKLNAGKISKNGNLIFPHRVIVLPLKPKQTLPQPIPSAMAMLLTPTPSVEMVSLPDVVTNEINLMPYLQFSKYDLQDRTSSAAVSLASNLGTGFQANWQQTRNQRWGYSINFNLLSIAFNNSVTTATPAITQVSKIIFSGGGSVYRILPFWHLQLGFNAGAGKSFFLQRLDARTLILRQAVIPYVGLEFTLPVWRSEPLEFSLSGGSRYLFPSSLEGETIHFGHLENLGLSGFYHFKKYWTAGIHTFGNYSFQRTAVSDYTKIDIALGGHLGIVF